MSDYRRFLNRAPETHVLPYFGGPFVEAVDRRLRLAAAVDPGFWRFEVTGRSARALEAAEAPDLTGLPVVRGNALPRVASGSTVDRSEYLVHDARAERLPLGSADEPMPFAPLTA